MNTAYILDQLLALLTVWTDKLFLSIAAFFQNISSVKWARMEYFS